MHCSGILRQEDLQHWHGLAGSVNDPASRSKTTGDTAGSARTTTSDKVNPYPYPTTNSNISVNGSGAHSIPKQEHIINAETSNGYKHYNTPLTGPTPAIGICQSPSSSDTRPTPSSDTRPTPSSDTRPTPSDTRPSSSLPHPYTSPLTHTLPPHSNQMSSPPSAAVPSNINMTQLPPTSTAMHLPILNFQNLHNNNNQSFNHHRQLSPSDANLNHSNKSSSRSNSNSNKESYVPRRLLIPLNSSYWDDWLRVEEQLQQDAVDSYIDRMIRQMVSYVCAVCADNSAVPCRVNK